MKPILTSRRAPWTETQNLFIKIKNKILFRDVKSISILFEEETPLPPNFPFSSFPRNGATAPVVVGWRRPQKKKRRKGPHELKFGDHRCKQFAKFVKAVKAVCLHKVPFSQKKKQKKEVNSTCWKRRKKKVKMFCCQKRKEKISVWCCRKKRRLETAGLLSALGSKKRCFCWWLLFFFFAIRIWRYLQTILLHQITTFCRATKEVVVFGDWIVLGAPSLYASSRGASAAAAAASWVAVMSKLSSMCRWCGLSAAENS